MASLFPVTSVLQSHAAVADPGLLFEAGHQIDGVEVAASRTRANDIGGDGDSQVGLPGARAADQDDVAPSGQERPTVKRTHQPLVDRRADRKSTRLNSSH